MDHKEVAPHLRRSFALALSLSFAGLIGCAGGASGIYDFDGDGSSDEDDCDSSDANIYPGADDNYGDNVDQNCDGVDGIDSDGDGYASSDSGGDDCNDGDASIHPGADDPNDAIDQDCDGFGRETTVDLRPDDPTTSDELYLQVDSDSAVLGISWFVDGIERTEYSGFEEIPGSQTSRGEAWRVEVIPYSGSGTAGATASDSVVIGNSAPSAATLIQGLVPDPREGDVLTASASASDDDLDTVTMLFAWFVNEVQVSPSPGEQLDSTHFNKGDSIYVVLTPSDGSDEGTPVASNTVTAVNTAPLAVSAAVAPTEGTEESTFSCAVSGWQDPDPADSEAYDVQWYINEVVSVPTATLDGTSFDRGDTLRCEATPNDGEETGSTLVSDAVTVANTVPVISSVTIDPAAGDEGTTFTCLPAGWLDPDPADAVPLYNIQWYVGAAGSEVASDYSETIDGSSFDRGDSLYCEVTPINELIVGSLLEAGAAITSAAIIVGNALPQIVDALIEPIGATTTDTLTVLPSGWTDGDGDAAAYQYQWWIEDPGGNVENGGTAATLAPGETLRGDTITVEVTPTDGIGSGPMVLAGIDVDFDGGPDVFELVIANTPPGPPGVSAIPGSPQISDDLVCSIATESTDPDVTDGVDSLSYDFQWLDDSGPSTYVLLAGTASSTLTVPSSATSQGQSWTCEITPSDSEGAGTSDSSLLVINAPPTAPTISVSIGTAPAEGDLVCAIATPATDPDGDPLSYDFEWLDPSGNAAYSLTGGAESATLSVPAAATSEDDTWTCRVSASDGLAAGPIAQETIVVPAAEACNSLSFDGVDDFVEVADAAGLDLRTQMTLSAWAKVASKPMGNFIVSKGQDSSSSYAWALNITAEAHPLMVLNEPGNNPHALGDSTVAYERWYHIAGTYDGAELKVYLDGVLDGSTQTTMDPGDQSLPVLIGRWPNQSYFLDGEISEIVLYDTALAASDIEQLRDAGPSAVTSASPVAWWDFEDATGSTLSDISGNNHHGTINGGATWTSSCPSEDLDGDGVPTWQDCDDGDEDSTGHAEDSNCDGVEDLTTSGGIELIGLEGGTFEMGCTAGQSNCQSNESPAHNVTLTNGFWMGETEVTQGQYQALMGNNPSNFPGCGSDCPVEMLNWYDAVALANELSTTEALPPCYTVSGTTVSVNSSSGSVYDCIGYRLPTEAEWEYAARAETDLLYAGSNTASEVAWYMDNSSNSTHQVTSKPPNAWGLYDMSGNVYEWTWDWYDPDYYNNSPGSNPEGPSSGTNKTLRGGGWNDYAATDNRVAKRVSRPPGDPLNSFGVRIARTVPSVDDDGDGVLSSRDCDDGDADLGDINDDANCDGVEDLTTSGGIEFIGLAGGTFEMGCTVAQQADGNCDSDESPDHEVTLSRPFWMGETEVTQGQYLALIGNNPSNFSSCGTDCPVETVNWYEALAFANALSAAEGLDDCYTVSGTNVSVNTVSGSVYDCTGYRLPTEAEWEYTARAGTDLLYAGSSTLGEVAWHSGNSGSTTHEVATLSPNAWGLYDMNGNVWEWTADWYGLYSSGAASDPQGQATGTHRVVRGAGYSSPTDKFRVSNRGDFDLPEHRYMTLGFRLARTVPLNGDGSSASTPGTDCSTILDSGFSTGDGDYWIDPDGSGSFEAHCDMTTDGGGWTQLADEDFSTDSCPGAWLSDSAAGLCSRQGSSSLILSASWPTSGVSYTEVRGSVTGHQWGSNNAFGLNESSSVSIDSYYVDGLSFTIDNGSGREHLFSYAVGLTSNPPTGDAGGSCPLSGGISPPTFVASDYECDTANAGTSYPAIWSTQAIFSSVEFQAQLSTTSSAAVEGRLMANEPATSEDLGISTLVLYIR